MAAEKGKKLKVAEKGDADSAEHLDAELLQSIEKLQEIQDELEKINEEASEKVLEVEQKYNEIRKPVYDKRNEIINSIPDFWLTAFLSHPALGELLTEEDQKIFRYVTSVEVEDFKDMKSGYSITLNFRANPFFEDAKLTKTYAFKDEGTEITSTKIKWKEGMGLPNGVSNEKKGNKRQLTEESFFSWFSDQQKDDMDEDVHDEIAELIKEDLWPNPLTYFNNEADEEGFDGEGDEEGKDDDDDDDDDEQDDDEDEEGN